jgi:DNA-3-methyladenine glycosylase
VRLSRAFFARPVLEVARELVGVTLLVDGVGGIIVETEAYHHEDPASHTFRGPTLRNAAMFGPPGRAYVYLSYGMHWCLNVVAHPDAEPGSGVLIRALEPTHGLETMMARRGTRLVRQLCAGPGRLTQALAVTRAHNAAALDSPPFALEARDRRVEVAVGQRIGISRAVEKPWRFGLSGSPFQSRPILRTDAAGPSPSP